MKSVISFFFCLAFAIIPMAQSRADSQCPEHYVGGMPPQLVNPKLVRGFIELCAEHGTFATGYSKTVRLPLYSAEHLTAAHIIEHKGRRRVNSFRPDPRLAGSERAELTDFKGSGFDRGHMAPDADSWSDATEADTYVLSNMVPQAPQNNRGLHAHIESAVRRLAKRVGELYVITGPVFSSPDLRFLQNRVAVPDQIFKLVYLPSRNAAAAYLELNTDGPEGQRYQEITVAQLNALLGMNVLPGVSNVAFLHLPKPSR